MRIGILSDSHDHLTHLERAVELLKQKNIDTWFHLGDYVAPFTAPILARLPETNRVLVRGNNDGEIAGLLQAFPDLVPGPVERKIDGRSMMLMHEPYALEAAVESGLYDVILYGHTHQFELRKHGGTLVLNPGEVCGWMTGTPTCAILDTEPLRAEIFTVMGDAVELPATPESP